MAKPRTPALRGSKEILRYLRDEHGVSWCRMTLWRRRRRPDDPFPGVLQIVVTRALFVTTQAAVARWVKRNIEVPSELLEDED